MHDRITYDNVGTPVLFGDVPEIAAAYQDARPLFGTISGNTFDEYVIEMLLCFSRRDYNQSAFLVLYISAVHVVDEQIPDVNVVKTSRVPADKNAKDRAA